MESQKLTEEIKASFRSSVKKIQEAGWTIRPNLTYVKEEKACCPIGSFLGPNDPYHGLSTACGNAGIGYEEGVNFARGFDREGEAQWLSKSIYREWIDFGAEMRKLLIGD